MNWINVNDQLPKVMDFRVLVYDGREVFQGYLNQLDQWCSVRHDNKYHYNVTHWMSLPEPPKSKCTPPYGCSPIQSMA